MTHIAVTSAVSARSSLWPCSASATAAAITPSASSSAIRPSRRSPPSRSSQNPGPAATCASTPPVSWQLALLPGQREQWTQAKRSWQTGQTTKLLRHDVIGLDTTRHTRGFVALRASSS